MYQKVNPSKINSIEKLINQYGTSIQTLHATFAKACQKYGIDPGSPFLSPKRVTNNNNNTNNNGNSSFNNFNKNNNNNNNNTQF